MAKANACYACHGSGAAPGTSPNICPECKGRGVTSESQGFFSLSHTCRRCGGAGTVIEDPCGVCGGSGRVRSTKTYQVRIPAGVKNGTRIKVKGKGEAGPRGGEPGDLYVVTQVDESSLFQRRGDDLLVEVPVTFAEAAMGAQVELPTPDGQRVKVKVPAGSTDGKTAARQGPRRPQPEGRRPAATCWRGCASPCPPSCPSRSARRSRSWTSCSAPATATRGTGCSHEPIPHEHPRYTISVAAELAGMHPQTLRMYDATGLVSPRRTPGGTRRYSDADVARLRKVTQLTTELGLNLSGAEPRAGPGADGRASC